jgi:tetratricopeptide (TPR) repeat protein
MLVGRQRHLEELWAALDEAIAGRGGLLLLAGEPGVGKTRLAEELAAEAARRGVLVVWGRGWEGAGAPAFWPWVQVLRACVGGTPGGPRPGEVASLVPELAADPDRGPAAGLSPDPEQVRFRLFDGVTRYLLAAAADSPLLVVLDDLHWADASSLQLLAFLAGELGRDRLLVVGTYRERELDPAVLPRQGRRLSVGGLAEAEVAELLLAVTGMVPSPSLAAAVRRRSGGNPFFVRELARLVLTQGNPDDPRSWTSALPDSVRGVLERRLRRLSEPCRQVLTSLAVAGQDWPLDLATAVTGLTTDRLLGLLDEAIRAGVVLADPGGAPGWFGFAHALVRDVLYAGLTPGRAAALHHRVGEVLEDRYRDDPEPHLAELANHFALAAAADGAAKAIAYGTAAGRRARRLLAYKEAAGHFQRALLANATGDELHQELLLAMAEALLAAGDLAAARRTYEEAADLARRRGRPHDLARSALGFSSGLGGFEVRMFDTRQIQLLEQALTALPETDSGLRAFLLARLAVAMSLVDSGERQATLSRRAVAMARRTGERAALAYALSSYCDAIGAPEHLEERLAVASEVVRLAEADGHAELALLGRRFRVVALLELGDMAAVDAEIEAFARGADALRQPLSSLYVPLFRGMRALILGRFGECERLLERVAELGRRAHSDNALMHYWSLAWDLRRQQGRLHEITADMLRDLDDFAHRNPALAALPSWRTDTMIINVDLGRTGKVRTELEHFAATLDLPRDSLWMRSMVYLAEACVMLRHREAAAGVYAALLPFGHLFAVDFIGSVCFGSVAHQLGLLAALLGRRDEASGHFEAALLANTRAGAAPLVADTQLAYARLLLTGGPPDRERAGELLRAATTTWRELGLDHRAAQAEALLGEQAGPGVEPPADNLFHREGELWTLAFAGRVVHLKDAKGLRDIARLLAVPGRAIHVTELLAAGERLPTPPRPATAAEPGLDYGGAPSEPLLDERARADYRRRLAELEDELAEAEANSDLERAATARAEQDFIAAELAAAYGLGGRPRRAADPLERARKAVSGRIRNSLRRIARVHPALGRHLDHSITTGTFCSYEPEQPIVWRL